MLRNTKILYFVEDLFLAGFFWGKFGL